MLASLLALSSLIDYCSSSSLHRKWGRGCGMPVFKHRVLKTGWRGGGMEAGCMLDEVTGCGGHTVTVAMCWWWKYRYDRVWERGKAMLWDHVREKSKHVSDLIWTHPNRLVFTGSVAILSCYWNKHDCSRDNTRVLCHCAHIIFSLIIPLYNLIFIKFVIVTWGSHLWFPSSETQDTYIIRIVWDFCVLGKYWKTFNSINLMF